MVLGDSISGVFHGIGSYCDRQKIRTFGSWFSIADAMGDLVLPSCDTLRNVIRVHMQQNTLCYFYPMNGVQHMFLIQLRAYRTVRTIIICYHRRLSQ